MLESISQWRARYINPIHYEQESACKTLDSYIFKVKTQYFMEYFRQYVMNVIFFLSLTRTLNCIRAIYIFLDHNIILPTAGGKVKNAQKHRQIDARGEADLIELRI